MRAAAILSALILIGSCTGNPAETAKVASKAVEAELYDRAAEVATDICRHVHDRGLWIRRTRIEARREIRQSQLGQFGPKPPRNLPKDLAEQIGEKTLLGTGPIVRIYCENDIVPLVIWQDLARGWRD